MFVEKPHLGMDQFREAIRPLEEKIRNCYEQPLHLNREDDEKFVDMMVYDGCFVVQLIREGHLQGFEKLGRHVPCDLGNDLLLLENQLPFFVLLKLYGMIEPNPGPEGHLYLLATSALAFFGKDRRNFNHENTSIRHLLHLVHSTFRPSHLGILKKIERSEDNFQTSGNLIPSATELEDAGIHFYGAPIQKMRDRKQGIENKFDIKFDNKKLKIPTLEVDDSTERIFRNYMAYEQFFAWEVQTVLVDYVIFIDKLINTSKDVELLRKCGIIDNLLGSDEAVTQMFNKLCNSVYYSPKGFYYNGIAKQLNDHCDIKWNKWKAALKKNYFNTPWSLISFLAALAFLLLTLLQTIFSVLSYVKQ